MFKNTRFPVAIVFENLEAGATVDQMTEWFDVSREHIDAVLEFAAQSLGPEPVLPGIYAPGGPMSGREVTI